MNSTSIERTRATSHVVEIRWPTVGEYGRVPVSSLIPNPNNPRKHFEESETFSLAESIKQGGQREVTTVRELTSGEMEQHPGARYMITSGGRRWLAAREAGAADVEIRVKAYTDQAAEELDMYMLNENRQPLSDLENMWAVTRLAELHGWETQTEIALHINQDQVWVSQILALARLCPEAQARMHPRVKSSNRMSRQVGVFLARLHSDVQRDLVERMPVELKTSAAQLSWLEKAAKERGVTLPQRERKPETMRRILRAFAVAMRAKATMFLEAPELVRVFENTRNADAEQLAVDLRNALIEFEKVVNRVEELSLQEKKQTMLFPKVAATAPVFRRPAPTPVVASRIPVQATVMHRPEPPPPQKEIEPQKPIRSSGGPMVTVQYWHETALRYVLDKVDLKMYRDLYDAKRLKFQKEGTPKPDSYPDRDQING